MLRITTFCTLLFAYFILIDDVKAQTPTLIKDINPSGDANVLILTNPHPTTNSIYFFADDGVHGWELWKTDGTAAGTTMVKDIQVGSASGICEVDIETPFYAYGSANTLFFAANDGTNGCELWKTDGTPTGTIMVKNINPNMGSNPFSFVQAATNKVFFVANNGTNLRELWVTDGTATGTNLVKDINVGNNSDPNNMCAFNGKVIFFANDGLNIEAHGDEPWISDGTTAGTTLLKDINIGNYSSNPYVTGQNFCVWNNKAYFSAANQHDGSFSANTELWTTDGTTTGTTLLKEICSGSTSSSPFGFTAGTNALYFISNSDALTAYELWKTNGTTAGTTIVKDIYPGGVSSSIQHMIWLNDRLYFAAQDGTAAAIEPWESDGTASGTVRIADLDTYNYSSSNARAIAKIGSSVYMWAGSSNDGRELFKITNGTTTMLTNLNTNYNIDFGSSCNDDGYSDYHALFNNRLFFAANSNNYGLELFAIDLPNNGIANPLPLPIPAYPNPTYNSIQVVLPSSDLTATHINITNLLGNTIVVPQHITNNIAQLDLSQLPAALYVVSIQQGDHLYQTQLIKY